MTEKIKTCDFYNEKICTLFSKYFGFNVECENLSLSTIDSDIERECPIKRLEQENKELKEKIIKLSEEKGHLIVENNTLKESNQSLSMLGTDLASANETVRKEFFRADKNKDMWREKAEEYRSALEEIKTVINQPCDNCKYNKDGITCSIGDCGEGKLKIIETRINEVLGCEQ